MNTTTSFSVRINIDQNAALLAGVDEYGARIIEIKPSTLTPKQRQTLIALNFNIYGSSVDGAIDGTESIEELLDRAGAMLDAKQKQIEVENADCIKNLTAKILDAPLSDKLTVDPLTGILSIERNINKALVTISGSDSITREWTGHYNLWSWSSPASGGDKRAIDIRNAVLNVPDVAKKISLAEQEAERLTISLQQARAIRTRVQAEQRAERDRRESEAAKMRSIQFAAFVAENMPEPQQKRYEAGLMADSEIIQVMADSAFKSLAAYPVYAGIPAPAIIAHVEAELGKEIYGDRPDVSHGERTPLSVTDEEFNRIEAIKAAMPGAKVGVIQHFGYCDEYNGSDDPELTVNACVVTVQVGELSLTREYVLTPD